MNESEVSTELQFDDLIDIKTAFKVDEDKEKQADIQKTITIDPMEDLKNKVKEDAEKEEDEVEDTKVKTEEVEDTDEEETEDVTEDEKALLEQVTDLKNMGALFLPDDYEIESIEKAVRDSEQFRNQIAVNTVFNSLPDAEIPGVGNAKELFAYLYEHKGTSVEDFKNNFGVDSFDPSRYDLEKESDRRKVLDKFFTEKGFTEVKKAKMIDKIFEDVEDEQEAKDALDELTTIANNRKVQHLESLKAQEAQKQEEAQQTYNALVGILEKNDVVAGFPLGKDEKPKALQSLYKQINVAGNVTTDFNYRLQGVVLQNPELTLALSAFLNTLSKDEKGNTFFDLSKFERKEKTKVVSNLKDIAGRVASGSKRLTSSADDSVSKKGKFKWDSVIDFSDLP